MEKLMVINMLIHGQVITLGISIEFQQTNYNIGQIRWTGMIIVKRSFTWEKVGLSGDEGRQRILREFQKNFLQYSIDPLRKLKDEAYESDILSLTRPVIIQS